MAHRTDSGRIDSAARTIRAAPETIYRAFVDPAALVAWLPPQGMTGVMEHFDPRPGGRYRMALIYERTDGAAPGKSAADRDIVEGRFVELVPDTRIVQAIRFVSDDPAFAGTMTMSWTLTPGRDGTEVAIRCENVPEGIAPADHAAGLRSTLANLAAFTEG